MSPPLTFDALLRDHADWDYAGGLIGEPVCRCGYALEPIDDTSAAEVAAHRAHLAAVLLAHVREAGQRPSPERMGDAEGDAWDELHGDSDVICTCDSCNFYSPTYNAERECSLNTHIEAIVAARLRALTEETR